MSEKETKKRPTKLEKFFKFLHFLEKIFLRVIYPYKRYGNLKKYNDGAIIFVGNHYSFIDVLFPCLATDRPIHFLAKQSLWDKGGIMKKFVTKVECIPVKRDGSDVQAIKDSIRVLKNGGVINIFPEGTRNKSYSEFLPFHSGAAALSIKTETPIIPFVLVNKPRLFRRTHVIYGDPVEFRALYGKKVTKEQIAQCDKILSEAMWNMRQAFLSTHNIKFKGKLS